MDMYQKRKMRQEKKNSSTNDKTSYQLSAPDSIVVNMNVNDLKKWNVKYLLSAVDISDQLKSGEFKFNIIKGDSKYSIYKLDY